MKADHVQEEAKLDPRDKHRIEWKNEQVAEHVAEPLLSSVATELIAAQLPGDVLVRVPRVVPLPLLATNPAKLCPAPSARHMLAGAILGDGGLTLDTLRDEQVLEPLFILPLGFPVTVALVPLATAPKTHLSAALTAGHLPFADAARPSHNLIAVGRRAPF